MSDERLPDPDDAPTCPERISSPGVERHERSDRDPESRPALEPASLWEGILGGHFSLVEQIEQNGQVFVVARRNDPPRAELTPREREAVGFAARRLSNPQISSRMGISSTAVAAHLANAAAKLGVSTREELVLATEIFAADPLDS